MTKSNWDRPRFRTQGRRIEHVAGSDVPAEFRTLPRSAPRPKADARKEAELALKEFMARKKGRQLE